MIESIKDARITIFRLTECIQIILSKKIKVKSMNIVPISIEMKLIF